MPKTAVISSSLGQRASVAALMLLMLGAATLLAYGASYRPAVPASLAGLSWMLPADWVEQHEQGSVDQNHRRFADGRRPALVIQANDLQPILGEDSAGLDVPSETLFRWLFRRTIQTAFPVDQKIEHMKVGRLEVSYWAGVFRRRVPVVNRTIRGFFALALVTDPDEHRWELWMMDLNYDHEDLSERAPAHRELFETVLESLAVRP